ncbi:MAG: hypothetical protein J5745_04745 [Bacteroidales bacterium]|nr:hypothetical protein [Bacteroidales bacterium]
MLRISVRRVLAAAVSMLVSVWAFAQTDGTYVGYSPYSVYGVGNLHNGGTAWNRGMGGVGIATRNKRFVNTTNPASITARDSLSFMSDFTVSSRLSLFTEGDKTGFNTTANLENFVISFPMWRNSAFIAGLSPFSDVGYSITDYEVDYYTNYRTFRTYGNGGLYQVYAGAAYTLWNRLSIGVQGNYIFGNINKKASTTNSDDSFMDFASGDSLQVNNFSFKAGLQYEQPVSTRSYLTLGATYRMSTPFGGHRIHYLTNGSFSRTREEHLIKEDKLYLGEEIGAGLSFRNSDVWSAEVNYIRSDWSNSNFSNVQGFSNVGESVTFTSGVGQSIRAGFEITPNRNDIRYFLKRCTYRAGAYYDSSYYMVNGSHVNAIGITMGMTLPVFRWYNGLTIGVDMGQRGLSGSQVKEKYIGFNLGMNMFDIWFKKPRYE